MVDLRPFDLMCLVLMAASLYGVACFYYTIVYVRQKEDLWNSIIAGVATGGFLSMHQGLGASAQEAMFGRVLLALFEGA